MQKALKFFDVTLRDGLQTSKKIYNISEKKTMLNKIMQTYNPPYVEVGSLVSEKVLPQMKGSIELYNYACNKYIDNKFFLLVPNIKYLKQGVEKGVNNFSFITSISDDFQLKNVNMDLYRTKGELNNMMKYLKKNVTNGTNKLYVSCINECPISGKINNNKVIEELLYYKYHYKFDNICLSDTCGTLNYVDLRTIVESIINLGMQPNKLSIHLHVGNNEQKKIQDMTDFLLTCGISMFDVSILDDAGGCSVTIDEGKTKRNLTYQDLIK